MIQTLTTNETSTNYEGSGKGVHIDRFGFYFLPHREAHIIIRADVVGKGMKKRMDICGYF